jgi:hypothetical protein
LQNKNPVEEIMQQDEVHIDWNYSGKADFLLGTSASKAEQFLGWAASLLGVSLYGYLYLTHALNWTWWQYVLAGCLSFDVIGGIVANSLNSCKRFYHTAAKSDEPRYTSFFKNHAVFSSFHIHTLLVSFLFSTTHYFYGIFWYLFLMIGTVAIVNTPLYLKRPAAFLAIALALLLNYHVIFPVHGFEWLVPALMIKILYGHLVREEPYRPVTEKGAL